MSSAAIGAFIAFWIVLSIGSFIFYGVASYETKKAVHPYLMIGSGLLFLGFAEWVTHWKLPWRFPVFLVLIIAFSIRSIRFCGGCNATLFKGAVSSPGVCSKCGTNLG